MFCSLSAIIAGEEGKRGKAKAWFMEIRAAEIRRKSFIVAL